jgi:hypothetical protein
MLNLLLVQNLRQHLTTTLRVQEHQTLGYPTKEHDASIILTVYIFTLSRIAVLTGGW